MSTTARVTQKSPYAIEVEEGQQYWWCACGKSKSQPFCDGRHDGSDFTPIGYTAKESGTVYFCGCRHTGNPPCCDGAHGRL